ncbi:Transport protein, major facilitator superfamily MFS_1 (plasmid) [Cupriavidus taiwanensis]|uniref:Transport protein, major facilitator superfamily MFS_1 n=2 Tax=Cupriavidus taiwanensis TaxID=164546 RepID=A0A375ISD2_9BURK|nr:Transport protein, major facilitator superfamily MFS_1 [Cupriavidus taiwanensis]SPK77593.1 Transport protein, major facilitator superfamily MFS_1 [Cupriavidus taiwanensis]
MHSQSMAQSSNAALKSGWLRLDPVLTIATAQLFGTSLWFSANSAADDLARTWGLTAANIGMLTAAVQSGFILGTLVFAVFGLADRFSASRIFCLSALLGAAFNAWFACLSGDFSAAIALRFAVGVCLAGVYPIGMKLIISWAPDRAGAALALLVGMLTLGTALPHGLRIVAAQWPWQYVMAGSSLLAGIAAVMVIYLGNGPHLPMRRPGGPNPGNPLHAFRDPQFRAIAVGYFGHMWELYAFWTILPMLVARSPLPSLFETQGISALAFAIIGVGAIGCVFGGVLTRWVDSARVALSALAISGVCCFLLPFAADALSRGCLLVFFLIWGAAVVADSPQFSALAAKTCPLPLVGGALAIQNSIGFALTVASITLVSTLLGDLGMKTSWVLLPGPVLGIIGFLLLRRSSR